MVKGQLTTTIMIEGKRVLQITTDQEIREYLDKLRTGNETRSDVAKKLIRITLNSLGFPVTDETLLETLDKVRGLGKTRTMKAKNLIMCHLAFKNVFLKKRFKKVNK